jgi:hypothetical protein
MRARMGRPWRAAASARARTSAAAPSEMDEEFAAVTVPPSRKAPFDAREGVGYSHVLPSINFRNF